MADTGLDVLWSSLYAKDSVVHMMNGHTYKCSSAMYAFED